MDSLINQLSSMSIDNTPVISKLIEMYTEYCSVRELFYAFEDLEIDPDDNETLEQKDTLYLTMTSLSDLLARLIAHLLRYEQNFPYDEKVPGIENEDYLFDLADEYYHKRYRHVIRKIKRSVIRQMVNESDVDSVLTRRMRNLNVDNY